MTVSYRTAVVVISRWSPSDLIVEYLRLHLSERVTRRSQILPEVRKHALPGVDGRFAIIDVGACVIEESVLGARVNDNLVVNIGGFERLLQLSADGLAGECVVLCVD